MKKSILTFIFAFALILSAFSLNAFAVDMTDGTYEVNIALWHSEDDKESMAADAVGKKATIVVENGIKTMHITSGEMSMMGIKASLQELCIADSKGNYTDAKVESKNSEGNPTGFYFVMPHTDEYITVKVNPHLAIMGNKDIGARIKVDYSTLELVGAAEAISEPLPETTVAQTAETNGETAAESVTAVTEESEVFEEITESVEEETTVSVQEAPRNQEEENSGTFIIAASIIAAAVIIIAAVKIKRKK